MYGWGVQTKRQGTIDDVLEIKASSGMVEMIAKGQHDEMPLWVMSFPAAAVDELVRRLTTARDAAALMASGRK